MKPVIILFVFLLFIFASNGQTSEPQFSSLNLSRIQTNKVGMEVLGGWAGLNIIGGNPETKHFHTMNAAWGVVNGVIALGGLYGCKERV